MKKSRFFGRSRVPHGAPAVETVPTIEPTKEMLREDTKRRCDKVLSEPQDYMSLFLHEAAITARSGKTVYICQEHHERISKILHVIGKNEVSMFSYIHNVLEHHFATCKDDISCLYECSLERNLF